MIFPQAWLGRGGGASLQRLRRILNPRFLDRPVKVPTRSPAADNRNGRGATRRLSVVALHARAYGTRFPDTTSGAIRARRM
jgi:hypothetical protein